jgi:hypothetical protein
MGTYLSNLKNVDALLHVVRDEIDLPAVAYLAALDRLAGAC